MRKKIVSLAGFRESRLFSKVLVGLIFLLAIFVRFYKLDWGDGYFFHPDEYHIVGAAEQLRFPTQMNPHFFAYGGLVVYLDYLGSVLAPEISLFVSGRFWSALFSVLGLVVFYSILKILLVKREFNYSLLGLFLAGFLPGLVQQAHFMTPESILIFLLFLSLYFGLLWLGDKKKKWFFLANVCLGVGMATKIVAFFYAPLVWGMGFLFWSRIEKQDGFWQIFLRKILFVLSGVVLSLVFFFMFSPYTFLEWREFLSSMKYEVGVGNGSLLVFYTRQFVGTVPILFHLRRVFPYVLGIGVLGFGLLGFFVFCWERLWFWGMFLLGKRKKISVLERRLLFVLIFFCLGFFTTAFMFAKWVRFMAVMYMFFLLFAVWGVAFLTNLAGRFKRVVLVGLSFVLIGLSVGWGLVFFSIYTKKDIRVEASDWMKSNLSEKSFVLTEAGNMLEVPLDGKFTKKSFDFYNLDSDLSLQKELPVLLEKADYFVVQSRRIFSNHQRLPEMFPITARFYDLLFSGGLGFEQISVFTPFRFVNDEMAEETWSVFDHPVIKIYKKNINLSKFEYEKKLGI